RPGRCAGRLREGKSAGPRALPSGRYGERRMCSWEYRSLSVVGHEAEEGTGTLVAFGLDVPVQRLTELGRGEQVVEQVHAQAQPRGEEILVAFETRFRLGPDLARVIERVVLDAARKQRQAERVVAELQSCGPAA